MQKPTGKREHNMTLCKPGIQERREVEGGERGRGVEGEIKRKMNRYKKKNGKLKYQ